MRNSVVGVYCKFWFRFANTNYATLSKGCMRDVYFYYFLLIFELAEKLGIKTLVILKNPTLPLPLSFLYRGRAQAFDFRFGSNQIQAFSQIRLEEFLKGFLCFFPTSRGSGKGGGGGEGVIFSYVKPLFSAECVPTFGLLHRDKLGAKFGATLCLARRLRRRWNLNCLSICYGDGY